MDTVMQKGTVVTASYLHEDMSAGGDHVFAGGLNTTAHLPREKNVGTGAGDPTAQSTIRCQED